jgi:hypothetical protein
MKRLSLLLTSIVITVAAGFFLYTYTNVSGQADKGWKVWVKTDPCSGLHDWVSVAKENPSYGGGGGTWANADLILFGSGMHCVRNTDQLCTFADATAEAALVRASSKFADYCCKEYSVWENNQTSKRSVVVGKFGTAGYGWRFLEGPMCCLEAEALAGIPGACSGNDQPNVGVGGTGVSGSWRIVQTDARGAKYIGVLKLNMAGDELSGRADWQNHVGGNITGEVREGTIQFNIHYEGEGGLVGTYEAELSSGGDQMVNGKARSNKGGAVVTWQASRLTSGGVQATQIGPTHRSPTPINPTKRSPNEPKIENDPGTLTDQPKTGNRDDGATPSTDQNWTGTWVGSYNQIVRISGGGSSISASFEYQQPGASGNGQWSNCRVTGNTAECNYTANHDDETKSGTRRGKLIVTLNGDTITGTYYEDEPQWTYKGDRNATNVTSAMYKGAQFPVTFKRQ